MNGSLASQPSLILAIDFGTQSVRALAYKQSGECLAKHQLPIDQYQHPEPGWTEHDVEGFWTLLSSSCQGLWAQGVDPSEIAAVISTLDFRHRIVVMCVFQFTTSTEPGLIKWIWG